MTNDGSDTREIDVPSGARITTLADGVFAIVMTLLVDDPDEEGFGDLTLGVKWNAVEAVGSSPGVAVVPRITLPVGEEPFTIDERVGFAVDVPVEAALGPSTSWNVSGGVAWTPVGDEPAFLGAGITYLLNPDAQIDVFVDAGLNDASEDVLVGSGISFRLR